MKIDGSLCLWKLNIVLKAMIVRFVDEGIEKVEPSLGAKAILSFHQQPTMRR